MVILNSVLCVKLNLIFHQKRSNNQTTDINGTATYNDPTKPNYLTVRLGIKLFGVVLFYTSGDYKVWETDYVNYAVVYSCKQILPYLLRSDTVWILTRTKNLTGTSVEAIYNTLESAGIDTSNFVQTQQVCNN